MVKKGKKVLSAGLSLAMLFGLIQGTTGQVAVYAEENDATEGNIIIEENFDDYESTASLKGSTFGNPTLTLVENGEGKALKVSDRTSNYFAYALNADKLAGNTVTVEADVRVISEEEQDFGATLKTTKDGEDDSYSRVAGGTVVEDKYTTISGTAEFEANRDSYVVYFETAENIDYEIDNIKFIVKGEYKEPGEKTVADISKYEVLKDLYADYFKMGVACEAISNWGNSLSEIGNEDKEALILKEFGSITFGNELKPEYNMGYNSPDATETSLPFVITPAAKEMLDFAKDNGILVRGHVLVWHSQCADAVFCKDYTPVYTDDSKKTLDPSCYVDKETMQLRLQSYINNVMDYMYSNGYAETLYAWDVVNEAVEPYTNSDNLRNSYWYQIMGKDFIYDAFKYTREAVAACKEKYNTSVEPKLFYNDYNEFQPVKCDAIIANLKKAKDAGYIDGVGMQAHLTDTTDIDSFITAMKRYDEAIGEVHVTELDVAETSSGVNADYYQAKFYYDLFKAMIDARNEGVNLTSVTIWGLTDDNSWKKESSPLIFKGDLSKKKAFDGIVAAATGAELEGPAYEAPDFKDINYDFEGEEAILSARGDGTISITDKEAHSGKQAILDSGRTATWNGTSIDVSRFAGQTIEISAWAKSDADTVKLSADIDGVWPNISSQKSAGEWVNLSGVYKIPTELTALNLYIEASDLSDIYIDDIQVKLVGMDEDFEGKANIASSRGVGHMPVCSVVDDTYGKAFKVQRNEADATMRFDVSKYVGKTVTVTADVKTADKLIKMGLDGDSPVQLVEVEAKEDSYVELTTTFTIPNTLTSANMYIETDGSADFYVNSIKLRIADYTDDVEGAFNFTSRWGGAGTVEVFEEADGNKVAKISDRDETYYGLVFDVSQFLGMDVEISFDVKTDDKFVKLSGDIDGTWPNYLTAEVKPGEYQRVSCAVRLPQDLSSLRVYVETDGNSDVYLDNLVIKRLSISEANKVFEAKDEPTKTPTPEVTPTAEPTKAPTPEVTPTAAPTKAPEVNNPDATPTVVATQEKKTQAISISKKAKNSLKIKAKAVKKKAKTIKLNAKSSGDGKLTYKVTKGSKKNITVSKSGKVTIKKGCKKGKYQITIYSSETETYNKASKVITINIK